MRSERSRSLRGRGPRRWAWAAGALSLAACSLEPAVGGPLAPARTGAGTYSALAEAILVPRCASGSCHGGSPPAAFPQLDAEAGWAAIVGVPSEQEAMNLVEPGDPERSWLLLRLRGEGGRPYMPLGDTQLTAAELAEVEAWIANGALND